MHVYVLPLFQRLLFFFYFTGRTKDNCVTYSLIDAVNYNGLLYFLLANLLTGVINLSIKTILLPPLQSVLIIVMYMLILSIISFVLYVYKLKIKFW